MRHPSPLLRYGVPVLAVAAAMLLRWPLWGVLGGDSPFLLLWPAVTLAAWYGGLGPGLLATLLAAAGAAFFLLEPRSSLAVAAPADLVGLGVFVAVNAAVSVLCGKLHRGRGQAERQRQALRASEEEFRTNFELAAVGQVQIDPATGRFLRVNRKFCEITGYAAGELAALTTHDLTHPADRDRDRELLGRMLRGEDAVYAADKRYVRRDGTAVWVSVTATLVRDAGGRPVRTIGVVQDLSARRAAEEALRASEARKAAILGAALDGIITIDHEGRVVEFNPAAESMFGYPREQVVGREMAEFIIPPPLREAHRRGMARYLATGEGPALNRRVELTAVRAGGAEFPVELAITPIPGDGHPVFTGFVRDISQRKAAEQALRESEQRLRTLADSIPQLAWTARPDGHIHWYNRRWYEYTGTTPEEMEGWGWQKVHDPAELPGVLERWAASLATGEPFEMVFPLRGGDGVLRPFLTRVVPLRTDDGRILQWFGTNSRAWFDRAVVTISSASAGSRSKSNRFRSSRKVMTHPRRASRADDVRQKSTRLSRSFSLADKSRHAAFTVS